MADWSASFDLCDVCRSYGVRIVRACERILAVYPPSLNADMVDYAEGLLDDARSSLAAHRDKLPHLTPADAATAINEIMRQHRGLRFCRGDDGSRWPLYPTTWTAGQKATVQSLWLVAGDALDADSFERVEP
ncbi:hypothetical protein [Solidesulfovibrio carbinoliphilus]|uniref:hypothetical protein n=1 Tax=Solidesulfovibrio carbinoliphilus TaxID=345370 RepID=UPI00068076F4|nr:hypothetical protein [Solidesulfovibrio carbinoliphilus]